MIGELAHAERCSQRALAILEDSFGKAHPQVAIALSNLATLYKDRGEYDRAEPLFLRAVAIYESSLDNTDSLLAAALNSFATLYYAQGLYGRAEPLFLRAQAIREASLGKIHPDVAASLNNLAALYSVQGMYDRAEPLFVQALATLEALLGKTHADVAVPLHNLAALYFEQGMYDRAEPLYRRSLAIREASFGKAHPFVAVSLHNLAALYFEQEMYDRAEPLYRRSLAIREASLGKAHPDVAFPLFNLANLYFARGEYGRAEPLYQRSLALWEAGLGGNHPLVAESLSAMGELRLTQHRLEEALPLLSRSFSISERRLRHEALDFSESRLSSFLSRLRKDEQGLYALLRLHPQDARIQHLALSAALLLKGRSVSETAHISRTINRSLDPEDRSSFERLRSLRTQLAALSFSDSGTLSPGENQQRLQSLTLEGDSLEADLAKRSAPLRALSSLPSPGSIVQSVAASLPKGAALVEFIAYTDRPLVPTPAVLRAKKAGQGRYLALILFPDASTQAVDLGPSAPIDQAAARLRDALANKEASFQASAEQLYRLAFLPLRPLLGSARRLFLSPDSQLNLIPFDALHDGQGFLLDSFDFSYLTSGRELLRSQDIAPASSVVVLADPDFTASAPATPSGSPSSSPSPSSGMLERSFPLPPPDLLRGAWVPLPGTRLEAQGIQRLLPQAQLFLGADASKPRLLNLPTPGILHLATHGFFLGDSTDAPMSRGLAFVDSLGAAPSPQQQPLLNSGLVLADASATVPDATSSLDASWVTALELAGLNLWGTQLVVLSACDTGRGEIHLGQGVYGLRRALSSAGAETVLASLWKVNDNSTYLLMDLYYRYLLQGQGRASALREAMKALRTTHPHPHAWAPFIALGSDASLRAISPTAPRTPPPGPSL